MDNINNNLILKAKFADTLLADYKFKIKFGPRGEDIRHHNEPVGQGSRVWDCASSLVGTEKAVISLLDRTITRGDDQVMSTQQQHAFNANQTFAIRTTATPNEYICEYNQQTHTYRNVSTITLQNQLPNIRVRIESQSFPEN